MLGEWRKLHNEMFHNWYCPQNAHDGLEVYTYKISVGKQMEGNGLGARRGDNIVTDLHYSGHPFPRGDVTGDTAVTTQR
jgi:hypothetical protein